MALLLIFITETIQPTSLCTNPLPAPLSEPNTVHGLRKERADEPEAEAANTWEAMGEKAAEGGRWPGAHVHRWALYTPRAIGTETLPHRSASPGQAGDLRAQLGRALAAWRALHLRRWLEGYPATWTREESSAWQRTGRFPGEPDHLPVVGGGRREGTQGWGSPKVQTHVEGHHLGPPTSTYYQWKPKIPRGIMSQQRKKEDIWKVQP